MKNEFGAIQITDRKILLREVKRMLPYTTVSILGPSGTGKTSFIEELANDSTLGIDEFIIFRLQGLSSEDFRMPIIKSETIDKNGNKSEEKVVEFANVGVFKRIADNPDKKFLLFFDEILRAESSVAPLLFSMLEKKLLDGVKRDNLYIMSAMNYGSDYSSNIDFSDDALRRRQIFIEYVPCKEDFVDFIKMNNYHEIIQEVSELIPINVIMDHETTKELMQPSTFGSWDLLNKRWKSIEEENGTPMDYVIAREDIQLFGSYFFTDKTIKEVNDKLVLLETINTIDLQKEIVDKNGLKDDVVIYDKKGKKFDKQGKEKELAIKTMNFVRSQTVKNHDYLIDNGVKVMELFDNEKTLLISLIKQIELEIQKKYSVEGKHSEEGNKKTMKLFMDFAKIIKQAQTKDTTGKYDDMMSEFKKCFSLMNSVN